MRDVVIIGAGPAGMTSAVYAARKKMDCVIYANVMGGLAIWSAGVENYMGYHLISGVELMAKFEKQVKEFDIPIENKTVEKVSKEADIMTVHLDGGEEVQTKTVIVATGRSPRHLKIPGEKEFIGKGVTYCATCDAPLFAKLEVAVIGGGNAALSSIVQLLDIAGKVYAVSQYGWSADPVLQERAAGAKNIEILKGYDMVAIEGQNLVERLTIKSRKTDEARELAVRGVFIEIGSEPNSGFVSGLVELNEKQEIIVDCGSRTNIAGIFAAGDVTNVPQKQIIVAAGEGAKAALSAFEYLIRLEDK